MREKVITMLIFRLKELVQVKKGSNTSSFFLEMAKIWVGQTEKRIGDGLTQMAFVCPFSFFSVCVIFILPSDLHRSMKLKNYDFPPSVEHLLIHLTSR